MADFQHMRRKQKAQLSLRDCAVEILSAVERLNYTPNENRSCVSLTPYVEVHSHRRD